MIHLQVGMWRVSVHGWVLLRANVFQLAYLFGDHCEKVWALLDFGRKGHTLPAEVDPAAPTQHQEEAQAQAAPETASAQEAEKLCQMVKAMKKKAMESGVAVAVPSVEKYLKMSSAAVEVLWEGGIGQAIYV